MWEKASVRYNAEKKKVGMYYSTPIWQFRMKCHLCNHWIEIHTDPKNAQYQIIAGARKREEEYDPEDNETLALKDDKEAERLQDPMYKLEKVNADIERAKESKASVSELLEYNDKMWKDPFTMSQKVRAKFRVEKKIRDAERKDSLAIRDKHNLLLDILPTTREDEVISKSIEYGNSKDPKAQLKNAILGKSIFSSGKGVSGSTGGSSKGGTRTGLKQVLSGARRIETDPFAITDFGVASQGSLESKKRISKEKGASSTKKRATAVGSTLVQYASSDSE
ncbi:hypothetical protein HDU79_002416 [Rhizoclosmatium sp. JEL0117]|nr:hypothetical protein HDU79_002416 [Rhizoclosmatium sp. JEL0117]